MGKFGFQFYSLDNEWAYGWVSATFPEMVKTFKEEAESAYKDCIAEVNRQSDSGQYDVDDKEQIAREEYIERLACLLICEVEGFCSCLDLEDSCLQEFLHRKLSSKNASRHSVVVYLVAYTWNKM
jgi:hypothetical protein